MTVKELRAICLHAQKILQNSWEGARRRFKLAVREAAKEAVEAAGADPLWAEVVFYLIFDRWNEVHTMGNG